MLLKKTCGDLIAQPKALRVQPHLDMFTSPRPPEPILTSLEDWKILLTQSPKDQDLPHLVVTKVSHIKCVLKGYQHEYLKLEVINLNTE